MEPPSVEPVASTVLEQHLAVASDPCPMCSYNLHRLKGDKCPECGFVLELRVAVSNPRMAAFYTGLIGLAAGVGFASLMLLAGTVILFSSGEVPLGDLIVLAVEAAVLGALALVWIRCSGRIRRLPAVFRWPLAFSTWLLSIFAMFFFAWAVDAF